MKLLISLALGFLGFLGISAFAQDPAAVAPVAAAGGIMGWVAAHGGFQASILFLVFSANTILSGLRSIVAKYDGVNPGDQAPAADAKLSLLNKLCGYTGSVLDYLTGNVQH